jgi:hypothetical protein
MSVYDGNITLHVDFEKEFLLVFPVGCIFNHIVDLQVVHEFLLGHPAGVKSKVRVVS